MFRLKKYDIGTICFHYRSYFLLSLISKEIRNFPIATFNISEHFIAPYYEYSSKMKNWRIFIQFSYTASTWKQPLKFCLIFAFCICMRPICYSTITANLVISQNSFTLLDRKFSSDQNNFYIDLAFSSILLQDTALSLDWMAYDGVIEYNTPLTIGFVRRIVS